MPEVGQEFDVHREFDAAVMPYCLMQYEKLSSTAKLCWAVLKYWSYKGKTPLTQEALARELKCSQSLVEKLLKELRDEGFIKTISPTHQERLQGKPARYVFLYHQLFADNALLRDGIKDEKKKAQIEKRASQKVNRKKKVAAPPPPPPVVEKKVEKPIDRDEHGWGLPDAKPTTYYDPYGD